MVTEEKSLEEQVRDAQSLVPAEQYVMQGQLTEKNYTDLQRVIDFHKQSGHAEYVEILETIYLQCKNWE